MDRCAIGGLLLVCSVGAACTEVTLQPAVCPTAPVVVSPAAACSGPAKQETPPAQVEHPRPTFKWDPLALDWKPDACPLNLQATPEKAENAPVFRYEIFGDEPTGVSVNNSGKTWTLVWDAKAALSAQTIFVCAEPSDGACDKRNVVKIKVEAKPAAAKCTK
jgi:hypothetical protein